MKAAIDAAVWRAYASLKIARITEALSSDSAQQPGYEFSVAREYVFFFLGKIRESLHLYQNPEIPEALRPDKNRANVLRNLDQLARYIRFFETGAVSTVPAALREHTRSVFNLLEPHDLILVRPQSEQTFETRIKESSLRNRLRSFLPGFVYLSVENPQMLERINHHFDSLPNIYIISYPKYLGTFLPLYPILGHEFGHILFETLGLEKFRVRHLASRMTSRRMKSLSADEKRAINKLISNWSLELYCDLIGWYLYGEPYIYALWLILLPEMGRHSPVPLQEYIDLFASQVGRSQIQARYGSQRDERNEVWPFVAYPAPERRLRELVSREKPLDFSSPPHTFFPAWRSSFFKRYSNFDEGFKDTRYKYAVESARELSQELLTQSLEALPPSSGSLELSSRGAEIGRLVESARDWIPPCQVSTPAGKLSPADWRALILAAWISFVEAANIDQEEVRGQDWPLGWVEFFYESFDMVEFYRTFDEIREGLH